MKQTNEALDLIKQAFLQAKRKKGPKSASMTLGVLKNRLLQLTNRQFDPRNYGASDLRSLVGQLGEPIRLVGDIVEYTIAEHSDAENTEIVPPKPSPGTVGMAGRIRQDLWLSVVDYASGQTYVWDDLLGRARAAAANDEHRVLPTLNPKELAEWRQEFIDAHQRSISGAELVNALRWQEQGLPTSYLPPSLQQQWNKDLTLRVRQRLHSFFATSNAAGISLQESNQVGESKLPEQTLEDEISAARDRGDNFSVGELLLRGATQKALEPTDALVARVICAWSTAKGPLHSPTSLAELGSLTGAFSNDNLATALVNSLRRFNLTNIGVPDATRDLAFKLREEIAEIYGAESRRSPIDACRLAIGKLDAMLSELEGEVTRFLRTTPGTAKSVSIEILKVANRLSPMLIPAERQYLRDVEVLIGPAFRKLCEAHERNDDTDVIRRAPELLQNIKTHKPALGDARLRSAIWTTLVQPIVDHLGSIVEEATSRGAVNLAPELRLRNPSTKADLRGNDKTIFLSFSLQNTGRGHAYDVSLQGNSIGATSILHLAEPAGPFDIPPEAEQLVRIRLTPTAPSQNLEVPIHWMCQTAVGQQAFFHEKLIISQQVTEPNWDALLSSPPYSLNPIRVPERLYGRESSLRRLRLAAMSNASTFVWGQKRIGKTSLLQVLSAELSQRSDTTSILLRMGELASLHEGQLARLIAQRLIENSGLTVAVPTEAEFGPGIGRLVPVVESLTKLTPGHKLIVIIDEFDDLDPAFYMGERGRQFVKALRSVSEVGMTFFFAGSERMEAIYGRHQADLNKWINVQLDRIDSRTDCRALIETPVFGVIEFSAEAIDFIIDYTAGNPFYIHNFCYQVFDRCLQEHRTFVDDNDTQAVRQQLLRALGPTNFAHFWEDNPLLDPSDKRRASAENCIALTCIASLGGRYETLEDLQEVQESLPLAPDDRAITSDLRRACERLVSRKVLGSRVTDIGFVIGLPIFREWLGENAVSKLLPVWTEYREQDRLRREESSPPEPIPTYFDSDSFPIAEDDMLAVAQRLIFCGRQKDVAEIRAWLRQFDDDRTSKALVGAWIC
jgi:hypothetical protein